MSALELFPLVPEELPDQVATPAVRLRIDQLRLKPSLRDGGVTQAHVQTLTQLQGRWPPILVARRDRTVVDGLHRVHAAKAVGKTSISCVWFDGSREDAFLEFVRRNVTHGLPLTLRERERAAARILSLHRQWSDRRIAELCGLSPTTVARIRKSAGASSPGRLRSTDQNGQLDKRIGRDGKLRPINASPLRSRIADALRANPTASLRVVASEVGASPETVRRVRDRLPEIRPAATGQHSAEASGGPSETQVPGSLTALGELVCDDVLSPLWRADPAVLSTPGGTTFAEWFTRTHIDSDWRAYVVAVPLSRVYELADEARRRAACWQQFAVNLEARVRPR
ncbi:MAG TPA: helix-turn-helix domain-containing protein [Acidimicrobiales bacterium]|nr:helix-turn-helix domain-containing protein [Acidimicrobiales bacterium]